MMAWFRARVVVTMIYAGEVVVDAVDAEDARDKIVDGAVVGMFEPPKQIQDGECRTVRVRRVPTEVPVDMKGRG